MLRLNGFLRYGFLQFLFGALPATAHAEANHLESLPRVHLELAGTPAVVFSASQKCEPIDIPDIGLRLFRNQDGKVSAFASHYVTRRFVGATPEALVKDCAVNFRGGENPDPSAFDDKTWIGATWTDDGVHITALGHQEYHGWEHPGRCTGSVAGQCEYDSITLLKSDDGGATFQHAATTPVAATQVIQSPEQVGNLGFAQPSNIVEFAGIKYVFVLTRGGGEQQPGTCLMRAADPATIDSWQIFDGETFKPSAYNPYVPSGRVPVDCRPVVNLKGLVWSVLRVPARNGFAALVTVINPQTRETNLATSFSRDLLHWSDIGLLPNFGPWITARKIKSNGEPEDGPCQDKLIMHYPSLVDPTSNSRNFDTTGDNLLLFFTGLHPHGCHGNLDRDLNVVPVRLVFEPS